MKKKGASLTQYAIVIAIVSVGIIGVYSMLGQQIVKQLNLYLGFFNANNDKIAENVEVNNQALLGNLTTAGQWGGTASKPVSKCVSGSCSIDFGNYILTGVPENLSDTVKSAGSSGANDKIYSLYMQLASQLEAEGKAAEAQDFKDMANLAKYMANLQKDNENAAKACIGSANESDCINMALATISSTTSATIPPEISKFFSNIDQFSEGHLWQESFSIIGQGRFDKLSPLIYDNNQGKYPSYAFVDTFDKIMNSSSLPQNLKGIAKELYLSVNDINQEFRFRKLGAAASSSFTGNASFPTYDPLTGSMIEMKNVEKQNFFTGTTLSTSNTSSSLTCASIDPSSSSCHQNL